jgi:hypothetical protein
MVMKDAISLEYSKECDTIQKHLKSQFQSWFAVNNLELKRITIDSPGRVLEKVSFV